jgi:thymidylate kinase
MNSVSETNSTSRSSVLGRTIGFIGMPCSGKTLQANLLQTWLSEKGLDVVVSSVEARTRNLLKRGSAATEDWPASFIALVEACDVLANYENELAPLLTEGRIVIQDRSRFCFEAAGRALGADMTQIGRLYDAVPRSDIAFLLDISPEEALRRRDAFGYVGDPLTLDLLERVRHQHMFAATTEDGLYILDAGGSPEEVHALVQEVIRTEERHFISGGLK